MFVRNLTLSQAVVEYLDVIFKKFPSHFENLFSAQTGVTDRLFSDTFNCVSQTLIAELNSCITLEDAHKCVDSFGCIPTKLNLAMVVNVRKACLQHFDAISRTNEWKAFWLKVCATVKHENNQEILYGLIANSFTFKLLSFAHQSSKSYYEDKLSLDQRVLFQKIFSNQKSPDSDAVLVKELQDEYYNKVIYTHFNYTFLADYINKKSDDFTTIINGWRRQVVSVQDDPRFISQEEQAYIELNKWLQEAIKHMKQFSATHGDKLRDILHVIHFYLEDCYDKKNKAEMHMHGDELAEAMMLSTICKELATAIKSKRYQVSFKYVSDAISKKQSKNYEQKVRAVVPPLVSASKSGTTVTKPMVKTASSGNMSQSVQHHTEQPAPSPEVPRQPRPASARKSTDASGVGIVRSSSLFSLSKKRLDSRHSPREGSPRTPKP